MASKVSIITINLNNRDGLKRTIDSVITQTFDDYEYLVIDGGSSDGSIDLIKENEDEIAYWVSEPDKGIYCAMNKGIAKSNGEYLLFLNSGDRLNDSAILEQVFDDAEDKDIVYGDGLLEANTGNLTPMVIPESLNLEYLFSSSLCHPATFIRKKLFDIYGLYDESLFIVSDWEFFLRTIVLNQVTTKKVQLRIARIEDGGMSRNNKNRVRLLQEIADCRKRHFPEMVIDLIKDYCRLRKKYSQNWMLRFYK